MPDSSLAGARRPCIVANFEWTLSPLLVYMQRMQNHVIQEHLGCHPLDGQTLRQAIGT